MKKAKPEHRRDYWKYHVAMLSFEMTDRLIDRVMRMANRDELFYPLLISIHVLYARPFRHPKAGRNIETSLIPDDLLHTHEVALQLRDRVFAHQDRDSRMIDEDSGEDLMQLVVRVRNGLLAPGLQIVFPTGTQLARMQSLCRHLYKACQSKGAVALNKCIASPPSDGMYRISSKFEGREPLFNKSALLDQLTK